MQAGTRVRISWQETHDIPTWNETCAWAVEQFGLPGDRYVTDVNVDNMTFWFRDHHDALLFKLCHGHSRLHPA